MHELSITQNILDITVKQAEQAEATKVSKVHLVIGEMSGIVGECVDFYFHIIGKNTIAAEAELTITNIPTLLKCNSCGREYKAEENSWTCPDCQVKNFEIVAGRELYVESIEVE
ncbi:MAG: hydrogenase maturation nickel metallochaperone HypA [Dehalococcoidales bacterium]|nr:hydrogenase maturation nickel metallochaperone HypA [Dehalococcoidales bacterium]